MLRQFNRNGVPVYALYAAGAELPRLLPEILTPAIMLEALDQL